MPARDFIIACWAVLVFVWLVAALSGKRTAARQSWPSRVGYVGLSVLAFALLSVDFRASPLRAVLLPHSTAVEALGAGLCALGLLTAVWARATLGSNWSAAVTLKEGHELVLRGPYGLVRHPIYTGILVMFLGTAISIGRVHAFLGLVALLASFWIKIRQEEALLTRHFPREYPAYRARVKALVPYLF